ncbi:replication-relaxation family protein [Kitasatospora sp. NPDC004669]|uniref:replication-relaxation family protein n=1 Tax=Kitasatospora sp. NPDC004669 TaxID=3154555 RepID=UPI0033BD45AB
MRADVLAALGVLKVATAHQLQRLLRPKAVSNKAVRQALGDLALHGLVASDGNTKERHKTWRLEGAAGLDAAASVLGMVRPEMGGTARGAGRSGAQHAMAVNETVLAFVLGGTALGAAGGLGTMRSWSTETEFVLPGGKRKVRPDGVWQAPEIGVPVLMVEVDRSTMAPAPGRREVHRLPRAVPRQGPRQRPGPCGRGEWAEVAQRTPVQKVLSYRSRCTSLRVALRRRDSGKLLRMTPWGGDVAAVQALVSRLEQDPLFVMSLGSKELFHSNLLAWLMQRFPVVAEAVTAAPGAVRVAREASHTDLLVEGEGRRRPLVAENKVFSLPDETQLAKIADSFAPQDPELLSLTEPLWDAGVWESGPGQVWRWMGYEELASRLRPVVGLVRGEDAYVADTMERWLDMVRVLGELAALVGRPAADEALMLPSELRAVLDRVRLDPGVQKMRFFHVAAQLRARGVETYVGLSNRTALIQPLVEGPEGITFGWQLQGP